MVSQLVSRGGAHRMVLELQPESLGRIQLSVERTAAGATHVALSADQPETLRALMRDHAEIARALDRAGVAPEQRTVTLAALPAAVAPVVPRHEAAFGDTGQQSQTPGQPSGQTSGQGNPGQPQDRGRQRFAAGRVPADLEENPAGRWLRRGFDITA